MKKYISISELSKELDLVDPKNQKPLNYILRFWEQKFKQIKPKIINKRRYYSSKQVQLIKFVNFPSGVKWIAVIFTSNFSIGLIFSYEGVIFCIFYLILLGLCVCKFALLRVLNVLKVLLLFLCQNHCLTDVLRRYGVRHADFSF